MNSTRPCGCKGVRSCIRCEQEFGIVPTKTLQEKLDEAGAVHVYSLDSDNSRLEEELGFRGIHIIQDFITQEEEQRLVKDLDEIPWDLSVSGRRKQNFGPRANFKKRKTKVGAFRGFPACTQFIQERFATVPLLESYQTVEQCSIEYTVETGASIEPHIDDCWIWGERIVQLNLLSPTYLSLTPYTGGANRYNLSDVSEYPRTVVEEGDTVVNNPFRGRFFTGSYPTRAATGGEGLPPDNVLVKVPLPPRSLLIMYGSARYDWEHCVLRSDIAERRVVVAYRELTPPYLPGGQHHLLGHQVILQASQFWDHTQQQIEEEEEAVVENDALADTAVVQES